MKFGVREICDVVLKAKAPQKIGNKIFYKGEPVLYFDTLKTSGMEGSATTVYAQGGRGNARLMAWEGERTVTFTMEDALISPEGFMILSGAGLIEANATKKIYQHATETVAKVVSGNGGAIFADGALTIDLKELPYLPGGEDNDENYAYVMLVKDGEIVSEPYIPVHGETAVETIDDTATGETYYRITIANEETNEGEYTNDLGTIAATDFDSVLVDYYIERATEGEISQIEITADKFGGNYYLEASTLFRNTAGVDMPAEFIIPNCKIQSNFNFSMASSGDPSTFTFTMDAFPDYTRFDKTKKVLAAIQIVTKGSANEDLYRNSTIHDQTHEAEF